MEQQDRICLTVAKIIREKSEAAQLAQFDDILTGVTDQGLLETEIADRKSHLEAIVREVVRENEDLNEISGKNGIPRYYSSRSLSETYAGILARKGENSLIADIVRENSKIYPRPVATDIFKESPFDLTQDEIFDCLRQMGEDAEYQDIAQTITSAGTIFLFSSRHLEPGYASTLAEWFDVGQINNP